MGTRFAPPPLELKRLSERFRKMTQPADWHTPFRQRHQQRDQLDLIGIEAAMHSRTGPIGALNRMDDASVRPKLHGSALCSRYLDHLGQGPAHNFLSVFVP